MVDMTCCLFVILLFMLVFYAFYSLLEKRGGLGARALASCWLDPQRGKVADMLRSSRALDGLWVHV